MCKIHSFFLCMSVTGQILFLNKFVMKKFYNKPIFKKNNFVQFFKLKNFVKDFVLRLKDL